MASVLSAVAVANEFRDSLAALEGSAVRAMLRTWAGVEEALLADFDHFIDTHPDMDALTPGQILRLERWQALQAQIHTQIRAYNGVAGPLLDVGQTEAAQLGALQAAETLDALGVGLNFNRLPRAVVQNIVGISRAGRPLQALLQPMYDEATTGVLRELTKGVALGRGPRDIARRMVKDGLTDSLNHLLLVTRDQYNRSHRTAALQRYEESGVVSGYVRRCARQPGRTCLACIALDGIFYKLKDEFEGHPQDRCVMIPAVKGLDMKPLSDGKAWFKNLPKEQQLEVMGPTRWEQWQSGELKWHQMVQKKTDKVWGTSVTTRPVGYQRKTTGPRNKKPAAAPPPKTKVKPEPKPQPLPEVDLADFPDGIDGLETVRGLGGSTGAKLVRDPRTGRQYVMKRGASPEHVRREQLADDTYRALGANVPRGKIYETDDGPVKLAEFIDGKTLRETIVGNRIPAAIQRQLEKDFAADVLVGNRDVIGEAFDNILVDGQGKVWRIDNGGAFDFRAQGGRKEYDRFPMELWSMRNQGINRQTHAVFGDMEYADLIQNMRLTTQRGRAVAGSLPAELRDAFSGRLDMFDRATGLFDEFTGTQWKPGYMDRFTYFDFRFQQAGIVDRLPKRLKPDHIGSVRLLDEKNREFDNLRGSDSVMVDVKRIIEDEGGDWGMISYYLRQQAGSSWSDGAQAMKYHIAQNMEIDESRVFWRDTREEARRQYDATIAKLSRERAESSWTGFHAWNYNLVSRVEMPNNDLANKAIRVIRTEDVDIMRQYRFKVGDKNIFMPRGLSESSSLVREVYVGGTEVTHQYVPHSRIFASYVYSREPDGQGASLHSDGENEFVFIPYGIPFNYIKSRY